MLTLLTYTLQDLCSLFSWKRPKYFSVRSVTRTYHCHQSTAIKWPSACTARCFHSILKKYIPHLLQRYVPDPNILQAGSGLGPGKGSLCISSIQNKCHKTLFFFFFYAFFFLWWWRLLKITARTSLCYSLNDTVTLMLQEKCWMRGHKTRVLRSRFHLNVFHGPNSNLESLSQN